MTDPKEQPDKQRDDEKEVKEPSQEDGTNWEEKQRIEEEGNEPDPQDGVVPL